MVLLGAVILPHGAMPFDGDPNSDSLPCRNRNQQLDPVMREDLSALYQGMHAAARTIAELKPDLVILNSPHGISLSDAFGIYFNENVTGNALWNGEWSEFEVAAKVAVGRSEELKSFFEKHGIPVQGIRSFGGLEGKLRWGEVIPIWYLQKHLGSETKFVIITNDLKPRSSTVEEGRLKTGKILAEFVSKLQEKVVVAISGDLAHFHPTTCKNPLYLPDTRSNMLVNKEESDALEAAMAAWVVNPEKHETWNPDSSLPYLTAAAKHDANAYACGFKGFTMLHGLMAHEVAIGAKFAPKIFAHRVPTYYGMMAATFVKL